MNQWLNTADWRGRSLVLSCIMALPFAGFLVSNGYPISRVESAAALTCLVAMAAIVASVCRRFAFYAVTLVCASAVSAVPLQRILSSVHALPVPAVLIGTAALFCGLMVLLRRDFSRALRVFAVFMFLTHILQSFSYRSPAAREPGAGPGRARPAHFLYIVVDEHMGPAGLPAGIAACRGAAKSIESTFRTYGFRLYPFAYANFPMTLGSLPSILNRQLSHRIQTRVHPGSLDAYGVHFVDARRFFGGFRSRGFDIRVLQCRSINFTRGEPAEVLEYSPRLGVIADIDGAWTDKLRLLVGTYQSGDPILRGVKGLFPFRFGSRTIGPLSLASVWPDVVLSDMLGAQRPTLFFLHLLTPHGPYLYREDGSIRNLTEWRSDLEYSRLDSDSYVDRYTRYVGQIGFLHGQLRKVLALLDEHGLLDSMTIVVHGDHGSRIRRRDARNVSLSEQASPERFDYTGAPDLQDLLDRFSALLAIKLPHQRQFSLVERKGSILRFLSEVVYREEPSRLGPAVDSVFLFDPNGNAKEIRFLDLWN